LLDFQYNASTYAAIYTARLLESPDQAGLAFIGEPEQRIEDSRNYGSTQVFIDSGGLMQLNAVGAQDVYGTGDTSGTTGSGNGTDCGQKTRPTIWWRSCGALLQHPSRGAWSRATHSFNTFGE